MSISALTSLGPRPPGDPAGMRQLAGRIRALEEQLATANTRSMTVSNAMNFQGPAAATMRSQVGWSQFAMAALQGDLLGVAGRLDGAAGRLEQQQSAYDRQAARLAESPFDSPLT